MTGDGDSGDGADPRAENARLVALLVSHGIEWRKPAKVDVPPAASALSADQKVTLFRRLWAKRQLGYRAMGYRAETLAAELLLFDDLSCLRQTGSAPVLTPGFNADFRRPNGSTWDDRGFPSPSQG